MGSLNRKSPSVIEFSIRQNVNSAALDVTRKFRGDVKINFISAQLSGGGYTDTLEIRINSKHGPVYDHLLHSEALASGGNVTMLYQPQESLVIAKGSGIMVEAPQGGGAAARISLVISVIEI